MTDLEYIKDDMFTRFMPNTPAGEDAWREMAKEDGVAAVLNIHAKSVISQLRKAGYKVAKAKKPEPFTPEEFDELFPDLKAEKKDAAYSPMQDTYGQSAWDRADCFGLGE